MSDELAKKLATFKSKGYVIAPAGYGKTHLIALAIDKSADRQLILTHTYAGVSSIKAKLNKLNVPSSKYHIDTIAGWSLHLCLAYPKTSEWAITNPTSKEWNKLYEKCNNILDIKFIGRILTATYSGIYVDEYQDCSTFQHLIISKLASTLPCRILGDPLQGIFDFNDVLIDWDKDIYPHFEKLGELQTPWRWQNSAAPQLGNWLDKLRETLIDEKSIKFGNLPATLRNIPKEITMKFIDLNNFKNYELYKLLKIFSEKNETVIVIYAGDQKSKVMTHNLSKNLQGRFSSIEEIECKVLFDFIKKLNKQENVKEKFFIILNFAKQCFTGITSLLTAPTKRGEIAEKTNKTKYPQILEASNSYLNKQTSETLRDFFYAIRDCKNSQSNIYRQDLFHRFMGVLNTHINNKDATLLEAANIYQSDFRRTGRPIQKTKLIGTTLLVKGLEYEHAIVIVNKEFDYKQLYVAMTRGSKSLTLIIDSS